MTHEPDPLENRADYLVPLNKLSPERRQRLLAQAQVIDLRRKQQLFAQGDRDDYTFYLLEGTLELYADGSLIKRVTGGEGPAYQPLAQLQPRQMSAMATTAAQVLRLRRSLLEQLLSAAAPPPTTASPAAAIEVIEAASGDDWLVALLQSDLFTHVPPANVQALLDILEPFDVAPGTAVIRQGDPGDYYYVIQAGRCEVVRAGARGRSIRLAELGPGDTFGEEALVSGATRNATVRMLDAGRLARLTKDDFARLIKAPLLDAVDRAEAERRVAAGARWLDVRFEDEHAHNGLPGSLNIPLGMLRMRMQELDPAVPWVAYCDTGGRSSSAAFLLSGHGFEACYVIDGAVAEHATTTAVVTPPVAGGARPGPQPAGSVPPAVAPAAVGDAADTALADERERLTAEAARLHEELAKTARLREALAAERAAVEAEREAASADAARLEARAAERLREAERRARAELEAERQRLAALYAKQAEQLEATQADREATLRAELAAELAAERRKFEQAFLRATEELEQARSESAAARDAEQSARAEMRSLRAQLEREHQRLREAYQAALARERARLDGEMQRVNALRVEAERAREAAATARSTAERELAAARAAAQQATADAALQRSLNVVEQRAQAARRDHEQAVAAATAASAAAHDTEQALERTYGAAGEIDRLLERELAEWVAEQDRLQESTAQRETLARQAALLAEVRERAAAARADDEAGTRSLIEEIEAQLRARGS